MTAVMTLAKVISLYLLLEDIPKNIILISHVIIKLTASHPVIRYNGAESNHIVLKNLSNLYPVISSIFIYY